MIFNKDLGFILFFCIVVVLSAFGLSLSCYNVVLFVILFRRFIYVRTIRIDKTDLISPKYQIIVLNILKN